MQKSHKKGMKLSLRLVAAGQMPQPPNSHTCISVSLKQGKNVNKKILLHQLMCQSWVLFVPFYISLGDYFYSACLDTEDIKSAAEATHKLFRM